MIPGWWTEHAVSERLAELRREAEHQRLVRWGRRGAKRGASGRCIGMVGWPASARRGFGCSIAHRGQAWSPPPSGPIGREWREVAGLLRGSVDGVLDGRWSEWFQGLQIDNQGGETILSGTLPDQPALHGILDKVRDLGLSIITVRRIPPKARQERRMRRIRSQRPNSKRERRWLQVLLLVHETTTSFDRAVSCQEPTQGRHEDSDRERVPIAGQPCKPWQARRIRP